MTGLPEEPPEPALVRVVTGRLEPDPPAEPLWEALVRVVTGVLVGTPTAECEPLVRVLTVPATPTAGAAACEALARVRGAPPATAVAQDAGP